MRPRLVQEAGVEMERAAAALFDFPNFESNSPQQPSGCLVHPRIEDPHDATLQQIDFAPDSWQYRLVEQRKGSCALGNGPIRLGRLPAERLRDETRHPMAGQEPAELQLEPDPFGIGQVL